MSHLDFCEIKFYFKQVPQLESEVSFSKHNARNYFDRDKRLIHRTKIEGILYIPSLTKN
jgi:hypothetical protein